MMTSSWFFIALLASAMISIPSMDAFSMRKLPVTSLIRPRNIGLSASTISPDTRPQVEDDNNKKTTEQQVIVTATGDCDVDCDCGNKATTTASDVSGGAILDDRQMIGVEQKGRVTMYKKEGCPFCEKAKSLLEGKYGLSINYVDIKSEQSDEILMQMRSFTGGRNTVPQIFFNAEHLGGNDDVQKLEADGVLSAKVDMVRSTPVTMMMDHWFHPWY